MEVHRAFCRCISGWHMGNQVAGTLHRHDARNTRHAQHIALSGAALANGLSCVSGLTRMRPLATAVRLVSCLCGHVHHDGLPIGIEMGQLFYHSRMTSTSVVRRGADPVPAGISIRQLQPIVRGQGAAGVVATPSGVTAMPVQARARMRRRPVAFLGKAPPSTPLSEPGGRPRALYAAEAACSTGTAKTSKQAQRPRRDCPTGRSAACPAYTPHSSGLPGFMATLPEKAFRPHQRQHLMKNILLTHGYTAGGEGSRRLLPPHPVSSARAHLRRIIRCFAKLHQFCAQLHQAERVSAVRLES